AALRARDAVGAQEVAVHRVRLAGIEPEVEAVEHRHARVREGARGALAGNSVGGEVVDHPTPALGARLAHRRRGRTLAIGGLDALRAQAGERVAVGALTRLA